MDPTVAILGIAGALTLGAMSPGPSFVLVVRTAVAGSRADGLAAALGMGAGGLVFGALALFGLTALLTQVSWLYALFKVAGGLYLLHLAWRILRDAAEPLAMPAPGERAAAGGSWQGPWRSFRTALLTQLSNPKTAVVYASIFAALLPADSPGWTAPGWMMAVLLPLVFLIEAVWYTIVALAFSADRPRAAYLRGKAWVDRLAGGVIALLGLRLILERG